MTGLEVGYQDPSLTFADRWEQFDRYRSDWDSLQWAEHTSLPLPFYYYRAVVGGAICLVLFAGVGTTADYRFIQLSPVLRGIPSKEWTLRGMPPDSEGPGLLPEGDLLAVYASVDHGRYVQTSPRFSTRSPRTPLFFLGGGGYILNRYRGCSVKFECNEKARPLGHTHFGVTTKDVFDADVRC